MAATSDESGSGGPEQLPDRGAPGSAAAAGAANADPAAWLHAAVAQYEAPLLRYASRLTGNVEAARDVVQDVFLRLCGQAQSSLDGHLAEWLYTVCRNRALDHHRREGRMQPSATTAPDSGANHRARSGADTPAGADALASAQTHAFSAASPADTDPLAATERKESVARALQLLGTLPRNQQEVLRLKFQEGLSYKEIAGITQLTVSHVGVLLHYGLKTLRARMDLVPRLAPKA